MTKIVIFGEDEEEQTIHLKLVSIGDTVEVRAVDKDGRPRPRGFLLSISSAGLYQYEGINSQIGFKLTTGGRLHSRN